MRKNILSFLILLLNTNIGLCANYLFADGKSDYIIVVDKNASLTEKTAAAELQKYLFDISGTTLPVRNSANTGKQKCIYVGWNELCQCTKPNADYEGYCYKTIGNNLFIYGGNVRGTMNGVFAFLEKELGVRWYTSECTIVPKQKSFVLKELEHKEEPVIVKRLDFCYDALLHNDWLAHNRLNCQYVLRSDKYGMPASYWGIHTFETLIPPSKYFSTHPEWFSMRDGRRSDKAQLCLSNPDMRNELIKNLMEIIDKKPGYWCYDVSQNDNSLPCECNRCRSLADRYGGESGVMIWFVNNVARKVRKVYPNIYIGTFAYRYTRNAPKGIKPASNVVVRLCDIECCMAHPLEDKSCKLNHAFVEDMKKWMAISKNIYIWNYSTGFMNYHLPFPNINAMADNYKFFGRNNVLGILEEGGHDAPWSEFSELKQWLIAKLLWNPYQNVDSLAEDFIYGYYNEAADEIMEYYKLCNSLISKDTHFTIKVDWNNGLYTDDFISKASKILEDAVKVSKKNSTQQRVNRVRNQILYLKLRRNPVKSNIDGTADQLRSIMTKDRTLWREGDKYTLNDLMQSMEYR